MYCTGRHHITGNMTESRLWTKFQRMESERASCRAPECLEIFAFSCVRLTLTAGNPAVVLIFADQAGSLTQSFALEVHQLQLPTLSPVSCVQLTNPIRSH